MGLKTNGVPKKPQQHDTTFTDKVIGATGPNADRRLAEVMPSLVRHLHAFAREVNLTVAEWTAAVDFVSNAPLLPRPPCCVGPDQSRSSPG